MVVKKNGKSKEERTMKKMMTNMKTLVALLMAGAAVTSCSSDNEMDSLKAPAVKTYTMTVQATKGGDATTRALADGGDGKLTATWATTENVYVKKGDTWATGSLTPQTAGASTTLKGTLSGVTFAADDVLTLQFPKSGDITYAGQKGTLADIAANFDWATATIDVASVEGGNITPKADASFAHQQAVVKFTLVDKANTSTMLSPTALTINDGTSDIVTLTSIPAETYTTNGAGVLYVALPAVSSKPITLTATVGTDTYTCTTSSAKSFDNGKFYRITAQMTKQAAVPTGALSGQFTVGMNGSTPIKVYFSKGNLQYKKSTNTWSFMDHQYSTVETLNQNVGDNYADQDVVSLFGWGTSGKTISNYGSDYQPYATSRTFTAYGPTDGTSGLTGTYADGDWGVNAISNGGNTANSGWRTLTSAEWTYLFNTRTVNGGTGSGKSYTLGQNVNGKFGVVLYPDDYTGELYTTVKSANWSAFESAGCVFLPAAGDRNGTSVVNVGSECYYWSSTANGTDIAYRVRFAAGVVSPADCGYRLLGLSVRLVYDVE